MAGKLGNKNAVGNSGPPPLSDKKLAAEVRNLALKQIKEILELPNMTVLKKQVILKLAGTVLPRLNEHSGNDGEPLKIELIEFGQCSSLPNSSSTASVHTP